VTHDDPKLVKPILDAIRQMRCCWCFRSEPSEAAHVLTKGMGGGGELSVWFNLAPLCRECHQRHHDTGKAPSPDELMFDIVCREFPWCLTPEKRAEETFTRLYTMRRAPKECGICWRCDGFGYLGKALRAVRCDVCEGVGILDQLGDPWIERGR
jgi:hypothetical protein